MALNSQHVYAKYMRSMINVLANQVIFDINVRDIRETAFAGSTFIKFRSREREW